MHSCYIKLAQKKDKAALLSRGQELLIAGSPTGDLGGLLAALWRRPVKDLGCWAAETCNVASSYVASKLGCRLGSSIPEANRLQVCMVEPSWLGRPS